MTPTVDGSLVESRYLRIQSMRAFNEVNSSTYIAATAYLDLPPEASMVWIRCQGAGGAGSGLGTIPDGSNRYRNGNGGGGGATTTIVVPVMLTGRRLYLQAGAGGNGISSSYGNAGTASVVSAWHEPAQRWITIVEATGGGGGLDPDAGAGGGGAGGTVPDPTSDMSGYGITRELPGQDGQDSIYPGSTGAATAHVWSYLPGKGGSAAGSLNGTTGVYAASPGYTGSGVFPSRTTVASGATGKTGETGPQQADIPQIPYPGTGGFMVEPEHGGSGGVGCGGGGGDNNGGVGGPGSVEVWWR
jgi:hypothetical protein